MNLHSIALSFYQAHPIFALVLEQSLYFLVLLNMGATFKDILNIKINWFYNHAILVFKKE